MSIQEKQLTAIVQSRNLRMLECFCMIRTYKQLIAIATSAGIDLDELEELLYEIS